MAKKKSKTIQTIESRLNAKQAAFMRLLAGAKLNIYAKWGQEKLNRVLLFQQLNSDGVISNDMCAEEKAKTQGTYIYTEQGELIGRYAQGMAIPKRSKAVVFMSGPMLMQDAMCQYGMEAMDLRLREMYSHPNIAGIVEKVDTGGGYSDAGDVLFAANNDRNKPIVTLTSFLASAGVKGTLSTDETIAISDSTTVGSIGTMMSIPKWYIDSDKDKNIELYSKHSDRKNEAWRALQDGNFEPYIEQLTENDELFMKAVKKYRPLKGDKAMIKDTLSGAVFPAIEAKRRGLIDGIGGLNLAFKRLNYHIRNS